MDNVKTVFAALSIVQADFAVDRKLTAVEGRHDMRVFFAHMYLDTFLCHD